MDNKLLSDQAKTERRPPVPTDIAMEAAQELRRARLGDLINAKCYQRATIFSKISTINPSLVSQYRAGLRPISARTITMIETAFALPGWFTQPEGTGVGRDATPALTPAADPAPAQAQPVSSRATHGRLAWLDQSESICQYLDALQPDVAETMLDMFVAQLKFEAVKAGRVVRAGESSAKVARAA